MAPRRPNPQIRTASVTQSWTEVMDHDLIGKGFWIYRTCRHIRHRMPTQENISGLPFMKMHGLGNDFVVIDGRRRPVSISADMVRSLGDRRCGVGFDQLVLIESDQEAAAGLRFWNVDGSGSAACGNATRCVARFLMDEAHSTSITLRTERGLLACADVGDGWTRVNMGKPELTWSDIPLSEALDTLSLPLEGDPVATGMGNPHCTFFVEDADAIDLETRGVEMERHPLFPERTNVQFCSLYGPDRIRLRVWERGAGVTPASGSSSCAAVVAAARRGLTGRRAVVRVDGGEMEVDWQEDGVWLVGPTARVFDATLRPEALSGR